jgi:hypothetical protein
MDRYAWVLDALRQDRHRRLRAFAAEGRGSFTTWLVAVVRRLCVDEHRHRYGRPAGWRARRGGGRAWSRRELVDLVGRGAGARRAHRLRRHAGPGARARARSAPRWRGARAGSTRRASAAPPALRDGLSYPRSRGSACAALHVYRRSASCRPPARGAAARRRRPAGGLSPEPPGQVPRGHRAVVSRASDAAPPCSLSLIATVLTAFSRRGARGLLSDARSPTPSAAAPTSTWSDAPSAGATAAEIMRLADGYAARAGDVARSGARPPGHGRPPRAGTARGARRGRRVPTPRAGRVAARCSRRAPPRCWWSRARGRAPRRRARARRARTRRGDRPGAPGARAGRPTAPTPQVLVARHAREGDVSGRRPLRVARRVGGRVPAHAPRRERLALWTAEPRYRARPAGRSHAAARAAVLLAPWTRIAEGIAVSTGARGCCACGDARVRRPLTSASRDALRGAVARARTVQRSPPRRRADARRRRRHAAAPTTRVDRRRHYALRGAALRLGARGVWRARSRRGRAADGAAEAPRPHVAGARVVLELADVADGAPLAEEALALRERARASRTSAWRSERAANAAWPARALRAERRGTRRARASSSARSHSASAHEGREGVAKALGELAALARRLTSATCACARAGSRAMRAPAALGGRSAWRRTACPANERW